MPELTIDDATRVLTQVFGHPAFRPGQAEAVAAVLAGRDAIVLLPTGAGKSSCYQVPAVTLARAGRGATIVVSPLIALMNDQVDALVGRGVRAAALHSQQHDDAQLDIIRSLARGELEVLYVSPERAASPSFRKLVAKARIALIAIDEAHCVSQWGHDFRPEYTQLHELRQIVRAPTVALTATATPRVMREIASLLELRDPVSVRGAFRRDNLAFSVEQHRGDATRLAATIAALEAAGLRGRSDRQGARGRGIVYCATRNKTESVARELDKAGFAVGCYHAGKSALARDRAQGAFGLAKTRVLVATNAFGMGVDYPDVRLIVHFQAPGSLEAYYQEAGRAGRDGEPGRCLLLFAATDLETQRALDPKAGDAIDKVERYARSRQCRQQVLCAHFDDRCEPCGRCDACVDPDGERAVVIVETPATPLGTSAQQVILETMAALARKVGRGNLALALRGSRAKGVTASGLDHVAHHGALKAQTHDDIVATIDQLVRERRLVTVGRKYPMVALPGMKSPRRESRPPREKRQPHSIRTSSMAFALETYRKQTARRLRWKSYMVFPKSVIVALDKHRPTSVDQLDRIPGLGPAKIARFGSDLVAIVRRYDSRMTLR